MNIFEALAKGNGKATVSGNMNFYYVVYENGRFRTRSTSLPEWILPQEVPYSALQHNDWVPYPAKTITLNAVPCGTCSNCGNTYSDKMIKLAPDCTCNECGKLFKFEIMPSLKVKHKEVFENVRWFKWAYDQASCVIYPDLYIIEKLAFIDKPPMKMTLEWEE